MSERKKSKFKQYALSKETCLIGFIIAAALSGFFIASVGISLKYDLDIGFTSRYLLRQLILSAIYVTTTVYDPVKTESAVRGPKDNLQLDDYVPIDDYFASNQMAPVELIKLKNEKIKKSRFSFDYQPAEQRLSELRDRYQLDKIVAHAKDELEILILLRNWARSQFRSTDYQTMMDHFDALEILDKNIRNNHNEPLKPTQYDPCHFFPLFYSQIVLSFGYNPRVVRISMPEFKGYVGHGMVEVWSNQHNKWISMDPDQNLHYERNGIPLNMLEIHNEKYLKSRSDAKILVGINASGDAIEMKEWTIDEMIRYHSYVQVLDMRNDWMTNRYFRGHPKRSDWSSLLWVDKKMPAIFSIQPKTNIPEDFYWGLNQTEILAKRDGCCQTLSLAFKTFTPNFKQFEITIDNSIKVMIEKSSYDWVLNQGINTLTIRSINQLDVKGVPSQVVVDVR